jgi:glycosyltransferase involved in cell wall biosynthesis
MSNKPRLCFVATVPSVVVSFLNAHIDHLSIEYDIYIITHLQSSTHAISAKATIISLPIAREIALMSDIKTLCALWQIFRKERFDIVFSVTPKAGLLSTIAGFFARIPIRIHWFTGQVWVTRHGFTRSILKAMDRLLVLFSTHLLADSPSQRLFLMSEKIVSGAGISVIGQGSICGVDSVRFVPNQPAKDRVMHQHNIPINAKIVLFLGRLNNDKGLHELALAIETVCQAVPEAYFLIVGPDENQRVDYIKAQCQVWLSHIRFHGFTSNPEQYMAAADIFCLPSYREGFGSAVLEAAACSVPTVATRIYGLTDAVEEGVTGILVPPRNALALAEALIQLLNDNVLRQKMGESARLRVLLNFSRDYIVSSLALYIHNILNSPNYRNNHLK